MITRTCLFNFLLQSSFSNEKEFLMRVLGVLIVIFSIFITIGASFFGLPSPHDIKGLLDVVILVHVMGLVIGGCLFGYGSEFGTAFKSAPTHTEAITATGVCRLAVRISIGSGFIGVMIGLISMLGSMGGAGMNIAALTGGTATALLTSLYGLIFAFMVFLPLQYYFEYQLNKDS